jgi:murein DD-endopeptidase MepM/ murein hydrolase activator NlpD
VTKGAGRQFAASLRRSLAGVRWPPNLLIALVAVAVCALLPARAAARGWERPVQGSVLRLFSVAPDRFAAGQHRGVDLGAPAGAPVRAACGGRVSFAGRVPRGGQTVSVRCGRLVATYQHLGVVVVRRGQVVLPGARIGTVGHARPRPHVHLGARDAATGTYVDPLALLASAPRALPPPLPVTRRPRPLGPAPARRPLPLRPAPVARPLPAPRERPLARPLALDAPSDAGPAHLPWPVWLGLVLFALGLPLGGLVPVRTRRRRRAAPVAQTA